MDSNSFDPNDPYAEFENLDDMPNRNYYRHRRQGPGQPHYQGRRGGYSPAARPGHPQNRQQYPPRPQYQGPAYQSQPRQHPNAQCQQRQQQQQHRRQQYDLRQQRQYQQALSPIQQQSLPVYQPPSFQHPSTPRPSQTAPYNIFLDDHFLDNIFVAGGPSPPWYQDMMKYAENNLKLFRPPTSRSEGTGFLSEIEAGYGWDDSHLPEATFDELADDDGVAETNDEGQDQDEDGQTKTTDLQKDRRGSSASEQSLSEGFPFIVDDDPVDWEAELTAFENDRNGT